MAVPGRPLRKKFFKEVEGKVSMPVIYMGEVVNPKAKAEGDVPVVQYWITRDYAESLESMYADLLTQLKGPGGILSFLKTEDWTRFTQRSPEWGTTEQKKSYQMDRATQLLKGIQEISRSLIAMYRDLKRIKECLGYYGEKTTDEVTLKGTFVDFVDAKKGAASMVNMEKNLQFFSLRDFFFKIDAATSSDIDEKVDALQISDRLKVVLKRKLKEYAEWRGTWKESLDQMKKVLEERIGSQEKTIDLYKEWSRPILRNIKFLEYPWEKGSRTRVDVLEAGNYLVSEVTVLGWKDFKKEKDIRKFVEENWNDKEEEKPIKKFDDIYSNYDLEADKEKIMEKIDKLVKIAVEQKFFNQNPYWIPTVEAKFELSAASPTGWSSVDLYIKGKIYFIKKFFEKFIFEWEKDDTEKMLAGVLNPVKTAKAEAEKGPAKPEYPGITEGVTSLGKSIKGAFKYISELLTGVKTEIKSNESQRMKLKAFQEIDDSCYSIYEKLKKAENMLTWGPWVFKDEENAWKWATEPIR